MAMNSLNKKALPSGVWEELLPHALKVIEDIKTHGIKNPFWTFGGGTVLMLRYQHRISKDIDIFVPDPQYLGFATPRLSDVAAEISDDYIEESSSYVKLIRPEGEIDFVASPNLTSPGFEEWHLKNNLIKVETGTEIVAKKLWHRGDRATARDLFDLALVIEKEGDALRQAHHFLLKNADQFIEQLNSRREILTVQFNNIETLNYNPTYDEALGIATKFLNTLKSKK
ncbi:nucleotidyl transferase AbiEii/AbiGii toxin family protein [Polynucleobacter cosmopolitanus]|jgi:predicted nucleotidyltransferase component of viral defense system